MMHEPALFNEAGHGSSESIADFIRLRIRHYVSSRKQQSLMTLSDKSGIPYNTVRRLYYGKVERPNLETVFALLKVIESREDLIHVMRRYYPDLGEIMPCPEEGQKAAAMNLELLMHLLQDEVTFTLFELSSHWRGVLQSEVLRLFGNEGLERIEELCHHGFVHLSPAESGPNSCYKAAESVSVQIELILENILNRIKRYDKSLIGTDAAMIATHTESLNLSGLKAMKQRMRELELKLNQIHKNPKFRGDIPYHLDLLYGLFDSQKLEDLQS